MIGRTGPGNSPRRQARAPPRRRRGACPAAAAPRRRYRRRDRCWTGSIREQRAAATADGPLLIIAGPGSGKTRTLTYRIAHQVMDCGLPAGNFLAITFTRRAAQEMQTGWPDCARASPR